MAFISQTVPNLIQGVSQQPDSLRYNTQAQKQDNAYGTPVDGLIKRPHTEFIDKLSSADASANQFFHSINRDENERFILEITEASTPTVKVYDTTDGAEKTVHVPDGTTYLDASSPSTAYKALTISDVTFIVNTEKTVAKDTDSADLGSIGYSLDVSDFRADVNNDGSVTDLTSDFLRGHEKLVYVKQALNDSEYRIEVKAAGASHLSRSGNTTVDATVRVMAKTEDTSGSGGMTNACQPGELSGSLLDLNTDPEGICAAWMGLMLDNGTAAADDGEHFVKPIDTSGSGLTSGAATRFASGDFKQSVIVRQGNVTGQGRAAIAHGSSKNVGGRGPVLHFVSHAGLTSFDINVESPQQEQTAVVIDSLKGVQSFVDLPPYAPDGFIAKVNGDPESAADDYFVEFVCNESGGFGNGYWRETLGVKEFTNVLGQGQGRPEGIEKSFDFTTMPHILIRQSDGSFMFTKADGTKAPTGAPSGADYSNFKWADRKVGDNETNPFPSFTDKKISNIFLHRGRLGLTAEESVVMSSANEFFNMHRTTMTTVLDGDPIDTDVSFRKVSLIRHAIPFNQNLILFSDTDQFALTGSPNLTPITARIIPITSYENVIDADPVPAASSLFFGFNHGNFAGVRELFPTDSTNFDALDITEAVPAYVPGKVRQFASSTDENIIAVLSSTETSSIYIYRYYEVGSGSQKRKIQSAWSRFTFGSDANIRHISFMDEDLFLMVQRTDGLHLEKMRIETKLVDTGLNFRAMLDRRITYAGTDGTITASFSAATGNTTFTFPYAKRGRNLDGLINNGVRVNVVTQPSDGGTTLVCEGDLTSNTIFFGEAYEMDYEFSTAYLRTSSQTAGQQPIVTGRYQLRFGNIIHEDTGFFTVEVASPNRDTAVSTFSGVVVGQDATDALNLSDGTFRFPILLKNTDATINIKNDSPFPSKFMAAAFEASYNTKVRQRL
jgi:hypothetical protein